MQCGLFEKNFLSKKLAVAWLCGLKIKVIVEEASLLFFPVASDSHNA